MRPPTSGPGLCGRCRHVRRIRNRRGSTFYLCRRAETDSRFRKYPPLPVLQCFGFEEDAAAGGALDESPSDAHPPEGRAGSGR